MPSGLLVGRVDRVEWGRHQAGHGCGGHDGPTAARLDGGPGGRDPVDDAVEVDGHGTPIGLGIEVVTHAAPRRHPGIEVRDVEPAEGLDRPGHGRGTGGRVGHVRLDEVPAQLVGDSTTAGTVDVRDDDVRTVARQVPGYALADAVAAAGDECNLAVHVQCHGVRS
jgi:hypothetical protein